MTVIITDEIGKDDDDHVTWQWLPRDLCARLLETNIARETKTTKKNTIDKLKSAQTIASGRQGNMMTRNRWQPACRGGARGARERAGPSESLFLPTDSEDELPYEDANDDEGQHDGQILGCEKV